MIRINDLSFRDIQLFLSAARLGNIGAAARLHHLSQPAASRALQRLEEQLQAPLLVHGRRRFELTEAGRALLAEGPGLLKELQRELSSIIHSSRLRLGMPHSLAVAWTPMTLDQPSPPFHWTLQTGRPDELWRKILDGTLDCAIVLDTSSYPGLDGQLLWQGRFELVAAEELPPCPVWVSTGQLDTLALNMHFQTKWQRPLAIAGELPSWEVIRAMAHRAKQVGWIPDYLLWGEKGLRVLNWQLAEVPYVAMLIAKPEFLRLPIASCMLDWLGTLLPNFHEPKHG